MPTERMTSFPAQPVTDADLQSIASHPDIGTYQPLYHRRDDPDAIIMFYLGINDRTHMLLYNPDDESWERVDSIDEPGSLTEDSGLDTTASQERLEAYYGLNEIEPVDYDSVESMNAISGQLPSKPLPNDQLTAISERSFIETVIPVVRRQSDDRSLAILLVVANPIEARHIMGSYGYDPNTNAWQLLGTIDHHETDDEEAFDAFGEDTAAWILDEYAQEEVYFVEDAENPISFQSA